MHALILAAVLAAAFAVATRYGRHLAATLTATAVLAGVLFMLFDWDGLLYASAWTVWRAASWHAPLPDTGRTMAANYARHGVAALAMALACVLAGQPVMAGFVVFAIWGLFATALDSWHAKLVLEGADDTGDHEHVVAWLSGGVYGVCLALVA